MKVFATGHEIARLIRWEERQDSGNTTKPVLSVLQAPEKPIVTYTSMATVPYMSMCAVCPTATAHIVGEDGLCPSLLSVAVIKHWPNAAWERNSYLVCSPSSREAKAGIQGRNLNAGMKAEGMEKRRLLTCSALCLLPPRPTYLGIILAAVCFAPRTNYQSRKSPPPRHTHRQFRWK